MKKSRKFLKVLSVGAIAAMMAAAMAPMAVFAAGDEEGGTEPGDATVSTQSTGGTLTIASGAGLVDGDTAKIYKVATLDQSTGFSYSWNTDVVNITGVTIPNDIQNLVANSSDLQQLAAELQRSLVSEATVTETINYSTETGAENKATISKDGYYLVVVTAGSESGKIYQPMLVEVKNGGAKEISNVKTSEIHITKTITSVTAKETGFSGESVSTDGTAAQVKIGDTVSYQLKTQIPNYDPAIADDPNLLKEFTDFTITDSPTNLTINEESIEVYLSSDNTLDDNDIQLINTEDTILYTVKENTDGDTVITLSATNVILKDVSGGTDENGNVTSNGVADYKDWYVFVKLDATLDSGATIEGKGNDNTATVTYGNDYATGTGTIEKNDSTKVYTTQLVVNKVDGDNNSTKLPGAAFNLVQEYTVYVNNEDETDTKTAEEYNELTEEEQANYGAQTKQAVVANLITDTDGVATATGLSAGTYKLIETKAPTGYVLDSTPITFTISKDFSKSTIFSSSTLSRTTDNDGFTKQIENTAGKTLPGTGGIGTTIFTVAGLGIIVIAGASLTIYLKKRRADEE